MKILGDETSIILPKDKGSALIRRQRGTSNVRDRHAHHRDPACARVFYAEGFTTHRSHPLLNAIGRMPRRVATTRIR